VPKRAPKANKHLQLNGIKILRNVHSFLIDVAGVIMELFETTSTINQDTFAELKWHIRPPKERLHMATYVASSFLLALAGVIWQTQLFIWLGLGIGIGLGIIIPWRDLRRLNKLQLKRIEEVEGIRSAEITVSFTAEKIKAHTPVTKSGQGTTFIDYSVIERIAITPTMFTLFSKENHFIAVNRTSLAAEKKEQEFIAFIRENCANLKWTWLEKYPPRKLVRAICISVLVFFLTALVARSGVLF